MLCVLLIVPKIVSDIFYRHKIESPSRTHDFLRHLEQVNIKTCKTATFALLHDLQSNKMLHSIFP